MLLEIRLHDCLLKLFSGHNIGPIIIIVFQIQAIRKVLCFSYIFVEDNDESFL